MGDDPKKQRFRWRSPNLRICLTQVCETDRESVQEQINLIRKGQQESLLVRMAQRRNVDGTLEGYVVAFDDVTDLVSAQRMAAWGDVARRIAHEIKNPLTPIQLSAERIKRKFICSGRSTTPTSWSR